MDVMELRGGVGSYIRGWEETLDNGEETFGPYNLCIKIVAQSPKIFWGKRPNQTKGGGLFSYLITAAVSQLLSFHSYEIE